jgi:hypothetical protein
LRGVYELNEAGSQWVPEDVSAATIEAISGAGTIAGTGTASGMFTIPSVLPGVYTLHMDDMNVVPEWVQTSSHAPDLSFARIGRAGETRVTTNGTPTAGTRLRLSLMNLAPWSPSDMLEVYVGNTGDFIDTTSAMNGISFGGMTLSNVTIPWTTNDFLVDSARGDVVYITQLAQQTAAGQPYESLVRYLAIHGIDISDGVATTVGGAFATVTQDRSFALVWNRSQYEALSQTMGPALQDVGDYFYVTAHPGGPTNGRLFPSADVLFFAPAPGGTDISAGSVTWGNPFPASWGVIAHIERDFQATYADTTGHVWTAFASIVQEYEASKLASLSPFAPTLGPISGLEVDGSDASLAQKISATPVVTWTAPAGATDYRVEIDLLDPNSAPNSTPVALITTSATSARVPAGVLSSGSLYFVRVTAFVHANDASVTPFLDNLPEMSTDYVSAMLTVR